MVVGLVAGTVLFVFGGARTVEATHADLCRTAEESGITAGLRDGLPRITCAFDHTCAARGGRL
ncbi:hypothetical protein DIE08_27750 [Burkholderia sp. Bp9004]|nr:hypothetical protein DIE08_27750 [Burkholderia sp. Bp9004]